MVRGTRPARLSDRAPEPVRTCVGCRKRASTSELLRVVAVGSEGVFVIEPDPARIRPGRGAHVHPDPACLALAERRSALGRALRVTGIIDPGPLRELLGTPDGGAPSRPTSKVGRPT